MDPCYTAGAELLSLQLAGLHELDLGGSIVQSQPLLDHLAGLSRLTLLDIGRIAIMPRPVADKKLTLKRRDPACARYYCAFCDLL